MSRLHQLLGSLPVMLSFACTGPDREFPASASGGSGPGTGATGTTQSAGSTGASATTSAGSTTGSGGDGPTSASGGGAPAGSGGEGGAGTGGEGGTGTGGDANAGGAGGGEVTSGGGGGAGPVCADVTHTCVPEPPVGWTGPVAFFEGPFAGGTPTCIGAYDDSVGIFNGDIDQGMQSCDCACNDATGIVCPNTAATMCMGSSMSVCTSICNSPQDSFNLLACELRSGVAQYVAISGPEPTGMGTCQPDPNHTLVQASFGTKARGCGGAEVSATGCGPDELCAPRRGEDFQSLCVVQSGDVACPDEFWTEAHVLHESMTDTRACGACGCGAADSACGGAVNFTYNGCDQLNTVAVASVGVNSCANLGVGVGDQVDYAQYYQDPGGTCPPEGGAPSGTLAVDGTITFCCAPGT